MKVLQLPPKAQEEILDNVEQIERRYFDDRQNGSTTGKGTDVHPFDVIAELAIDVGVTDIADRHDFYAHGKLED